MNTDGGKRNNLKFSEESSLQILIYITSLPQFIFIFFFLYFELVNSDLVLPAAVFSLFVSVFCVSVLTAVYRLSNITTQITFLEIIVIQFVCSSEKPIVCLEQKLSGSESDLCPIKQGISLLKPYALI